MVAVYIDSALQKIEKEIRYTFDFVFKTMGYEYKYIQKLDQIETNDILIYYGLIEPTTKEAYILALDKILFFIPCETDLFSPGRLNKQILQEMMREIKLDRMIPLLSKQAFQDPIVYCITENLYFGSIKFDLIGNIFFNLFNYQKFTTERQDYRIPDEDLVFYDYTLVPYVNYYLWILEQTILEAINKKRDFFLIKKAFWPQAQKGAVAVSHNVSTLRKWNFSRIMKSISTDLLVFYKFDFIIKNFLSKIKYIITNIEEYWNFEIIDKLEKKYEMHSTYFWGTDPAEFEYDLQNNDVYKEISRIIDRGHEIALLAKSNSYNNDNLQRQKKKIVQLWLQEKVGVRIQGYKSDPYLTNELILKHNFAYDSSRKFETMAGFINGLGFPFHLMIYTKRDNEPQVFANNNNLEIPLICSDESFILSKTSSMSHDNAKQIVDRIFEATELVNGLMTFDFSVHNFAELDYLTELMEYVIKRINAKDYFVDTYLNIAQWWKKRERIEILEKRSSIELYFPEKIDFFSFSIMGNKTLSHVDYPHCIVKNGFITLSQIEPDTKIKVFLDKVEANREEL